jgi:hypothetical protein
MDTIGYYYSNLFLKCLLLEGRPKDQVQVNVRKVEAPTEKVINTSGQDIINPGSYRSKSIQVKNPIL